MVRRLIQTLTATQATASDTGAQTVTNVEGEVQYLAGSDETDTFIIEGDSADYAWSTFSEDDGTEGVCSLEHLNRRPRHSVLIRTNPVR